MLELRFEAEDLGRIRFAVSLPWEIVAALRTLSTASVNSPHAWWLSWVRPRTASIDLNLLTSLVRPEGYIPDFLVPLAGDVESGLAAIAETSPAVVREQLRHLAGHTVAQRGSGRAERIALLAELAAAPEEAVKSIVAELRAWWQAGIEPHWPRVRALLHDDVSYRLDELAAGGVHKMFKTLHPRVSFTGDRLRLVKYYSGTTQLRRRGLVLVPSAFAWPDVLVSIADPDAATMTYAPRGLGRLWLEPDRRDGPPLAALLGRSRSAVLTQLDLPMSTTQLATLLDLAAPTVSAHLKVLEASGLVRSRRDGHAVLYRRTRLADALLRRH
jgi:DNA-binding transcriptional ArsR family regulator